MEEKIYLIYNDSIDDASTILGYIKGTEEDADKYCDEYNANCKYEYQEIYWMVLENLSENKPKWSDSK